MKNILLLSVVFIAVLGIKAYAQKNPEITASDLKKEIGFLASDSLKGRRPGMPEEFVAARYIRNLFKTAGLQLLFDQGIQEFEVVADIKAGPDNAFSIGSVKGEFGKDFTPLSFSANGKVVAPVAFAGYGFDLNLDSVKWNDYSSVDVKGKWAMVLRGDPEPDKANSGFLPFEQERMKATTAHDKGAVGLLLVTPSDIERTDVLMHMQYDKTVGNAGFPVINISRAMADKLLSPDLTVAKAEAQMKKDHKPVSLELASVVNASTDVIPQKVKAHNVAALIKGSDPAFCNDYVVIGAHFDHLGMGGEGSGSREPTVNAVHNGADDNASGTAGVIELAQKLQKNRKHLKKNVIVVSFSGEEMGLLGSKEFVKNPPIPLKQIDAMINLDMVGRLNTETNTISIGGTGTSTESDTIIGLLSANRKFRVTRSPDGYGPSDHASFYSENIPVLYFTTGVHDDYHTPSDDADKINYTGEVEVLKMVYELALNLANREHALVFRESGIKQTSRYGRNLKVTLRIIPDMVSNDNNGLRVDGVIKGGPAESAHILKGDRIVSIEGKPVTNIYDYMARLSKLIPGQVATVEVIRNDKKIVLIVQL
jgi:aminopeptidase YwaD